MSDSISPNAFSFAIQYQFYKFSPISIPLIHNYLLLFLENMPQNFSTIKHCKIQHNLWKLIYKYVDIYSFLCICFKKAVSRKESFFIFFIMNCKTAVRLLLSFYSFLIFLVFVIEGSSSFLSLHCNYFK